MLTKLIKQRDLTKEEALFFDPQLYNDTEDADLSIKTDQGRKEHFHVYDEEGPDMRHILGFLNQSEWVNTLNIGNIMQLAPIQLEDLVMPRSNESELSRDSFLESVSFIIVGYFCVSTEIRFIIQLKEEQSLG